MLDEIQLHVAPLLLRGGVRLFDSPLSGAPRPLERIRVVESPSGVTHVKYSAGSVD